MVVHFLPSCITRLFKLQWQAFQLGPPVTNKQKMIRRGALNKLTPFVDHCRHQWLPQWALIEIVRKDKAD